MSEGVAIRSIYFRNFKVLRETQLPVGPFTLLIGPNGSGKSTAIKAFHYMAAGGSYHARQLVSAGVAPMGRPAVALGVEFLRPYEGLKLRFEWTHSWSGPKWDGPGAGTLSEEGRQALMSAVLATRVFSLDAMRLAQPVQLAPDQRLSDSGDGLAGVLDHLRDHDPERFEALNAELARWLPEFDRILFDTPGHGMRALLLRTRKGQHAIPASDISQGTLLALAILTLAYSPELASPLVCIEEPDRGIHPRLLREVRDALYRLAYPQEHGESRHPVQVIATTHSPYMLDLFKDHPDEIVIAHKHGTEAEFQRLADRADLQEALAEAPLGDAWYSGILGGVPADE